MAARFRGYLPVVLDVETGGFNARTDALLEVALALPMRSAAACARASDALAGAQSSLRFAPQVPAARPNGRHFARSPSTGSSPPHTSTTNLDQTQSPEQLP